MAVCEIAGLKDIPVSELPDGWLDSIPKQEYRHGTDGGDTSTEGEKKLQDEIARTLMEMAGGNRDRAREMLAEITSFEGRDGKQVPGVRTTKRLTGKRLEINVDKVRRAHAEWCREQEGSR
jgi:hypothetical protein